MAETAIEERLAARLHEAAETYHVAYRITDGKDEDWASWYAGWLLELSELPEVLEARPVRSHLIHALVQCDLDYDAATPPEPWPHFYARHLTRRFTP